MEVESQHGRHSSPSRSPHNGVGVRLEDPEMVQEICYLDQVLRDASDTPTNGSSSPQENRTITVDSSASSVHVSASSPVNHEVTVERWGQTTFVDPDVKAAPRANGHAEGEESAGRRFELRAYQEEVRPAKLFTPGEEEREREIRVRRTRPSEEVEELEKERQELIKGQAVKMNPGIAQRWWNPPQEAPLEEQLDPEQLESHRKYQERKQRQSQGPAYTQMSGHPCLVSFDQESIRKEDIVEEQIDFLSARKQFLQGGGARRDVAPQIYSAKPFARAVASGNQPFDIPVETGEGHLTWSDEGIGGEFTCARAVMTILKDEEEERSAKLNFSSSSSSYPPEEFDSGLDELSIRSQDTTLDNVSDSGASLPPTPLPLTPVSPPTPQPSCPRAGPTEEELEFHAGVLVHHAIQHALAAQNGDRWQTPDTSTHASLPSPRPSLSPPPQPRSLAPGPAPSPGLPSPQPNRQGEDLSVTPDRSSCSSSLSSSSSLSQQQSSSPPRQSASPPQTQPAPQLYTPSPPVPEPVSPPQRARDGGPRIRVQSSYARALAAAPAPAPAPAPVPVPRPAPVCRPPSPPSPERPEFSYFSKYSEAAELRSTAAVSRAPESEPSSGPFRLRSRKQQTLSMIEEEIRAAQQREEELKKQRLTLPLPRHGNSSARGNSHGNRGPRTTISPGDKMKSNSLPTRLTLTSRTAPGKIEKVRPVPPVSPSPSEGALSDAGSEDSGGKPKNYMQTLMEDYETHKVKRRDKLEDNSVLEATRVTRRKSNMALKWEAGIYANEDGLGNEEEEEEEEEEE